MSPRDCGPPAACVRSPPAREQAGIATEITAGITAGVRGQTMWIMRILVALLAAAAIVVVGIVALPGDRMARVLEDQLSAQTGREVTIAGEARLSLWPELAITASDVTLGNADWAGAEPMLVAGSLSAGLSAPALLSGDIRITRIRAEAPVLRLERHADGRGNWQFAENAGPGQPLPPVALDLVELVEARLVLVDPGGTVQRFGPVDARLRWPDPAGPARLDSNVPLGAQRLEVSARIDAFARFLRGEPVAVAADLRLPALQGRFEGELRASGAASGRLEATTGNIAAALAGFGLDPVPGLSGAAAAEADLALAPGGAAELSALVLRAGEKRLEGHAGWAPGQVPRIDAMLVAPVLDLSPFLGGGGGGDGGGDGWSRAPIDAAALARVEGRLGIRAETVDLGRTRIGPLEATLSIDRARAVLDMHPAQAFGGQITGQLVANNRNGLSVGGDLRFAGLEAEQALGDLAGWRRLSGQAAGQLKFLGIGNSVDAIMRSLSGAGRLEMGRGVISGLDLDRLMGSGTGGAGTTVFDSLTASYSMEGGNLRNDDLLMALKNFRVDGQGRIGLGARDIDYVLTPVALRARGGQGIAIPVSIKGPWANPRIRADLEAAIRPELEGGQDAIEAEAKEELRQKLEEELDAPITDRESLEDALKQKLQEEAAKGLLKLLGAD